MIGRPSKYRDDIPERTLEYVKTFKKLGDLLPTMEGLVLYLGVPRSTLYDWAKQPDKQAFSDALDVLKQTQAKMLFENGLEGKYNSTITKLMLSHNHNVYEKSAKEISGPDGGPVAIQEVRRTIVRPDDTNG
jgi:hypothetical protein